MKSGKEYQPNPKPNPIRVLMAKPGLDGHNSGALVVAQALRDAGMEVIYTGLHRTPEEIALMAIQEDVDIVGLSILSGAHRTLCPKVIKWLKERDSEHIPVIVGGFIPGEDIPQLEGSGIAKVFSSGTELEDIIDFIRNKVSK